MCWRFLALANNSKASNLDSFSNLKGILVNVKKGLPPLFYCLWTVILKDKLIIENHIYPGSNEAEV
jgi:hypothetical protein